MCSCQHLLPAEPLLHIAEAAPRSVCHSHKPTAYNGGMLCAGAHLACTGARPAGQTRAAGMVTRPTETTGATLAVQSGSWTPLACLLTRPLTGGPGRAWTWTGVAGRQGSRLAALGVSARCSTSAAWRTAPLHRTTPTAESARRFCKTDAAVCQADVCE